MSQARPHRQALTLLEMLISTTLALLMAGLCVGAYLQAHTAILNAEIRLTLNDRAQAIYHALYRNCQSAMPQCGMVIVSGIGSVQWIFMRGKEDSFDYNPSSDNYKTDLLWQEWQWTNSKLLTGSSSPERTFAASQPMVMHGVNFRNTSFINLPQPRRWLDPSAPLTTLDDNVYFPSNGPGTTSNANPTSDIGDATDLSRNLAPAAAQVTNLTLQLVCHDGSVRTFDGSASSTTVFPGVWLDGRLAARLSDPPNYTTSPIPQRPELVRIRFTLAEVGSTITQTYCFSFNLPGLDPTTP